MVFDDKIMQEINKAYYVLDKKRAEIIHALSHRMWELESGWYNGHFHKKPNGDWERESYPIPVVTVRGLCDVEIGFEKITVTAKLKRRQALTYSFNKFTDCSFEAYGVENYLNDFYTDGQTLSELKDNIEKSQETDIGFSFYFPFDTDEKTFFEFVKLIRREGFFY